MKKLFLTMAMLIFATVQATELASVSTKITTDSQPCLSLHLIRNTPTGYINEAGEPAGIHFDFLTALEEKSGLCFHKKLTPYMRARKSIYLGGHDGGIMARSDELDAYAHYIVKLITLRTVVIPKLGVRITNYQDLSTLMIGRVRGTQLHDTFDNDERLAVVELLSYEHGLQLLKKGRIDAIAGSSLGLSIIGKLNMLNEVDLSSKLTLGERELWLVVSKKLAHLNKIKQLRQAAQELIDQGVFADILTKYYGENWQAVNQQ